MGVSRALRALRVWRQLTDELRLIMAIPEKRTLGSWARWLGVLLIVSCGVVVIPRDKLLRAAAVIVRVLADGCEFHEYRSLCGLLEHFRAVNLQGRNVMHGLYAPHGPEGASREGPNGRVRCDALMIKQLRRWLHLIAQCAGVSAKVAVSRERLEPPRTRLQIIGDTDACHGDEPISGLGGTCHGLYWYLPVPAIDEDIVYTAFLELLGVAVLIVMLDAVLGEEALAAATIVIRTDALTAALALPAESLHSPPLVAVYQALRETAAWRRLSPHLKLAHLYGDGNILSDAVSRAKWAEFHRCCSFLGISPTWCELTPAAHELYRVGVEAIRSRRASQNPSLRPPNADGAAGPGLGTAASAPVDLSAYVGAGFKTPPPSPNYSPPQSSDDESPPPAPPPPAAPRGPVVRRTCRMRTGLRYDAGGALLGSGAGPSAAAPPSFYSVPAWLESTSVEDIINESPVGEEEKAALQRALEESMAPREVQDTLNFVEAMEQAKANSLLPAFLDVRGPSRRDPPAPEAPVPMDGVVLAGQAAAAQAVQERQGDKAVPGGDSYQNASSAPALFVIVGRGIAYGTWGAPDRVRDIARGSICKRAINMRHAMRITKELDCVVSCLGPREFTIADDANFHPCQQSTRGADGERCLPCGAILEGTPPPASCPRCGNAVARSTPSSPHSSELVLSDPGAGSESDGEPQSAGSRDEVLPLGQQGRVGDAARAFCRRAAESRSSEAAICLKRCAARQGCKLLAAADSIFCNSSYCGRVPSDDCVVQLTDREFQDLYGRHRSEGEASYQARATIDPLDVQRLEAYNRAVSQSTPTAVPIPAVGPSPCEQAHGAGWDPTTHWTSQGGHCGQSCPCCRYQVEGPGGFGVCGHCEACALPRSACPPVLGPNAAVPTPRGADFCLRRAALWRGEILGTNSLGPPAAPPGVDPRPRVLSTLDLDVNASRQRAAPGAATQAEPPSVRPETVDPEQLEGRAAAERDARGRRGDKAAPGGYSYEYDVVANPEGGFFRAKLGASALARASSTSATIAPPPPLRRSAAVSPGGAMRGRITGEAARPGEAHARRRLIGGLAMLPAPPAAAARADSALARASQEAAMQRAKELGSGGGAMAFDLPEARLEEIAAAMDEGVRYGVNSNTASFDERAWDFWEIVCAAHNTSPLRTPAEALQRPERTAHLLAALMMYASAVCTPRTAGRTSIKPRSALAYPLAIVRVFGRWGTPMPSYKVLKSALAYLSRLYLAHHGPYSLMATRAEPMKYDMVLAMFAIEDGASMGSSELWRHDDHDTFMFRRLICVLWVTAFRLAEIVCHTSGEIMFLLLLSLTWSIGGVVVTHPSPAALRALRPGVDYARLAPPRSKPDQWGEIHCPHPITLTFYDEPGNAAAALRDIEIRICEANLDRATTPLFHDANGQPYSHGRLERMLRRALTHLYGASVASLFTFHSFRSGLATALHAAGVPGDQIMLVCRWMCAASLMVYRRRGTDEHEMLTRKAMRARVDTIQSGNVVSVVGDQRYAELVEAHSGARSRECQKEYEDAVREAVEAATDGRHLPAGPPAKTERAAARPRAQAAATEAPGAVTLKAATALEPGDAVVIRRAAWPAHACRELGGSGWAATVISLSATTARVRFTEHKAADGRPYEDVRVAQTFVARRAD